MKSRLSLIIAAALTLGAISLPARADSFSVDPVHSTMIFKIFHFNTAPFYGRFDSPQGSFTLDKDPAKCSFDIHVQADHVDTANPKRDSDLKGPDFFNAKQFPTISFKSTKVEAPTENAYKVTGDLTIHGVTKSTTITIEKTGEGNDPMGKYRAGLSTSFTLKRSDFGMTYLPNGLGDDVTLLIGIEGLKQ